MFDETADYLTCKRTDPVRIELIYVGPSHGSGMIVMRVPKERVLNVVDISMPITAMAVLSFSDMACSRLPRSRLENIPLFIAFARLPVAIVEHNCRGCFLVHPKLEYIRSRIVAHDVEIIFGATNLVEVQLHRKNALLL